MTSKARIEANRRNAKLARGPRTAEGLARSSQNARKHGILAAEVVLPHVERAADWTAHRKAVLADLAPFGAIEQALAERVAGLLWRLRRVERYETATLAEEQHGAEAEAVAALRLSAEMRDIGRGERTAALAELPVSLAEARDMERDAAAIVRTLDALAALSDDRKVERNTALGIVYAAETEAEMDLFSTDIELPGVADDAYLDDIPWTARLLRTMLEGIAKASAKPLDDIVAGVRVDAGCRRLIAEKHLAELEASVRHRRAAGLMLAAEPADKVSRYESNLERSLYRALHELQRLQADRGARASAPPALDVDVSIGPRGLGAEAGRSWVRFAKST